MIYYFFAFFFLASFVFAGNGCPAPNYHQDPEAFQEFLKTMVERGKLQGIAVAVVTDKGLDWHAEWGLSNRETGEPITRDTVFRIASVSKVITSAALIRASQMGLIQCQADLNLQKTRKGEPLLPFTLQHPKHPDVPITAELLNNFYGGFRDNEVTDYFQRHLSLGTFLYETFTPGKSCNSAINWNAVPPGAARCYSNVSSALVGYLVERASGMHYQDFTLKELFTPLNMEESAWHRDQLSENARSNLATPYSWFPTGFEKARNPFPYPFFPAGSLNTSTSDLAHFVEMLLNDGAFRGTQILPKGIVDSFGSGTFLPECEYETSCQWYKSKDYLQTYFKMGSSFGVSSAIMIDTKRKRGYIGLANGRSEADTAKSPKVITEILAALICQDRIGTDFDLQDFVSDTTTPLVNHSGSDSSHIATCNICHKIDYTPESNCLGCKSQ